MKNKKISQKKKHYIMLISIIFLITLAVSGNSLIHKIKLYLPFGEANQTALLKIASPLSRQIIQRDSANNGSVPIEFTPVYRGSNWQATFFKDDGSVLLKTGLLSLSASQINAPVKYPITLPAGGWYKLQIDIFNSSSAIIASNSVEKIGVGEIFITAGQSNATSIGEKSTYSTTDHVSALNPYTRVWQKADDPQPYGPSANSPKQTGGSPWPLVGDTLSQALGVPIGFVNAAVGGTGIRDWQKGAPPASNFDSVYNNLIAVINAIPEKKFRAFLWHQGENNTLGGADWVDADGYYLMFKKLTEDVKKDSGVDFPWIVSNASYIGPNKDDCSQNIAPDKFRLNAEVRWGQQRLWEDGLAYPGPDTDDLYGKNRYPGYPGNCVHFSVSGLKNVSMRWIERIMSILSPATGHPADAWLDKTVPLANCLLKANTVDVPPGGNYTLKLYTEDIITKSMFSSLGIDSNKLYQDLMNKGYINNLGQLQNKFRQLSSSTQFSLDQSFQRIKANIFIILKRSQRPLPAGAKGYWNGTRDGVIDVTNQLNDQTSLLQWSKINSDPNKAGIYTRSLTILDSAGRPFCRSNSVTYRFQGSQAMPVVNLTVNGQKSISLKPGENITWSWSSINPYPSSSNPYASKYISIRDQNKTWYDGTINSASGSSGPTPITQSQVGQYYCVTYWAIDAKGQYSSSSVLYEIR